MDESEIEAAAQRAVRNGGCMRMLAQTAYTKYWPGWKLRSVMQRVDQQLDPYNTANPMQMRLWLDVLRDTGDDEMLGQVIEAHREGKTHAAERDRDRAIDALDRERRRMRVVSPRDRVRRTG